MTRFWWVRHGPTHRKDLVGWTDADADLSDVGALGRLSAHLPAGAPVISSDLIRCRATADAIADGAAAAAAATATSTATATPDAIAAPALTD